MAEWWAEVERGAAELEARWAQQSTACCSPPASPDSVDRNPVGYAGTPRDAVEIGFKASDYAVTEAGLGNTGTPSSVPAAGGMTNAMIQRRWSSDAMFQLFDDEGNSVDGYEYEVSYNSTENPDPTPSSYGRVEGRQPVTNEENFLGKFIIARRTFGASSAEYNSDQNLPTNTVPGTGTVTIFARGRTATIRFTVSVTNGRPTITPESSKIVWSVLP